MMTQSTPEPSTRNPFEISVEETIARLRQADLTLNAQQLKELRASPPDWPEGVNAWRGLRIQPWPSASGRERFHWNLRELERVFAAVERDIEFNDVDRFYHYDDSLRVAPYGIEWVEFDMDDPKLLLSDELFFTLWSTPDAAKQLLGTGGIGLKLKGFDISDMNDTRVNHTPRLRFLDGSNRLYLAADPRDVRPDDIMVQTAPGVHQPDLQVVST